MITKERLEELIKEKATIFVITRQTFIAGVSNFIGIEKQKLSKENNIGKDNTLYWRDMGIAELEYLFETKEKAEFALKYKRIPRTEYLDLPDWEEIHYKLDLDFIDKNKNKLVFRVRENFIDIINDKKKRIYGYDNATKENYISACLLCKKLFLGEYVK